MRVFVFRPAKNPVFRTDKVLTSVGNFREVPDGGWVGTAPGVRFPRTDSTASPEGGHIDGLENPFGSFRRNGQLVARFFVGATDEQEAQALAFSKDDAPTKRCVPGSRYGALRAMMSGTRIWWRPANIDKLGLSG
jgi:hypothetical protein